MRVGPNETGSSCLLFMSFSPYCWSITTQPRAQPVSAGLIASVHSHTWPLTPTFRTCHSRALQPWKSPKPHPLHLNTCLFVLFIKCSTALIVPSPDALVGLLTLVHSLPGPHFITVLWTRTSPPCSATIVAKFLVSEK